MPLIIPQTPLTDDYQDFILGGNLIGGNVQITANPATVQIQHGQQGFGHGVPELSLPLGSYSVGRSPAGIPLTGLRAKNASPGLGAVLGAYFWTETDPTLSFIGLPSSQAVGAVLIPRVALADFPPVSPADEQVVALEADIANEIVWLVQFHAATGEWNFIGGPPLFAQIDTAEALASPSAYVNLATVGPTLTIPRAGDYNIAVGCRVSQTATGDAFMSPDVGGVGALDVDAANTRAGGGTGLNGEMERLKTGIATGATVLAKYKMLVAGTGTFSSRWMRITPRNIT